MNKEDELDKIASELPIWEASGFKCYLCGYEFVSVYPFYLEEFECPGCGNFINVEWSMKESE